MSIQNNLKNGIKNGLNVSLKLIKVIIPFYIATDILSHTPVANILGKAFAPLMKPLGLTGKMAVAIISGYLVNLYAAIAALVPLHPTWQQVTIVGLMTGISHNLVIEGAVLHKTGTNAVFTITLRVIVSIIAGLVLNTFFRVVYG
ncbi:nucleoside recognition domain-containing protein [Hippea maritima]|uniref:Nucleoside recognition domain protein n=1 Tax=Hippea maritima (strain ATCC 700847 / DSM 10411 / MH2) TaxID=760142 RepID=F2LY19_HIPMA|nr:nucleoside recognition domain-containing protein [Hippea maritima]AEA33284.1 nucleoside recognition domain protein [Hippea maritima DSM 10411]